MNETRIRPSTLVAFSALCLAVGTGLGWLLRAPAPVAPAAPDHGTTTRMGGYTWVRPLLECDMPADAERMQFGRLGDQVRDEIARDVSTGMATHVSVYLRDLNSTAVLGINEKEGFSPASLLKVPVLMMALRSAERDPGLLDRQVVFDLPADAAMHQNLPPTATLTLGEKYSVSALLEQMIVQSDNAAMGVVGRLFTPSDFSRTFTDLGVPAPDASGKDVVMSVAQYASFFRILYNAAYLGPEMSERALNLLSRVRFVRGLVAGVPPAVPVAHKFGERRYAIEGQPPTNQLHDCGVVYFPGRPYLLCLMTRGQDWNQLADVLKGLSSVVYRHYADVNSTPQGVASSGSP